LPAFAAGLPLHCCLLGGDSHSATGTAGAHDMSKGIDRKKESKKKPALNLMQKRAAKAEKKKNK
jgi:hypothetical protein